MAISASGCLRSCRPCPGGRFRCLVSRSTRSSIGSTCRSRESSLVPSPSPSTSPKPPASSRSSMSPADRKTRDPEGPPFRERGFDIQFQIPIFDGGEVRVRQAVETYNQAFNLLTEKAVNVRSEARDAFRVYRSTYDIAGHYQREVLPLRKIISDEMQLRFSSMQVDVFALLTEARQRIAGLRAAIEAKREFWLAQSELKTAVNGGGGGETQQKPRPSTNAQAGGVGQ